MDKLLAYTRFECAVWRNEIVRYRSRRIARIHRFFHRTENNMRETMICGGIGDLVSLNQDVIARVPGRIYARFTSQIFSRFSLQRCPPEKVSTLIFHPYRVRRRLGSRRKGPLRVKRPTKRQNVLERPNSTNSTSFGDERKAIGCGRGSFVAIRSRKRYFEGQSVASGISSFSEIPKRAWDGSTKSRTTKKRRKNIDF